MIQNINRGWTLCRLIFEDRSEQVQDNISSFIIKLNGLLAFKRSLNWVRRVRGFI